MPTTVSDTQPSDVLTEAAQLIETRGWCQRQYCDLKGRLCAAGAIHRTGGSPLMPLQKARDSAKRVLERLVGVGAGEISVWNDSPVRTQAEVVAKLREAAEVAKAEGR